MALIGSLFRLGMKLGVLGAGAAGAGYLLDKARIGRERALAPRAEPLVTEEEAAPAAGVDASADTFAEPISEPISEPYTEDIFGPEDDALNQTFETLADGDDGDGESEFIEDEDDQAFVVRLEDEGHLDLESVDAGVVANGIAALEEADDRRHELND